MGYLYVPKNRRTLSKSSLARLLRFALNARDVLRTTEQVLHHTFSTPQRSKRARIPLELKDRIKYKPLMQIR